MTSQGTAHGRFERAIHRGHVQAAEMAAREMGGLSLADALMLCELLAAVRPSALRTSGLTVAQRFIEERLPPLTEVALAASAARADATDCGRPDSSGKDRRWPESRSHGERCNGGGSNAEDRPDCGTVKRREAQPCLRSSVSEAPCRLRKLPRPGITLRIRSPEIANCPQSADGAPEGVSNTQP
jgi:hypothetical protein